MGIDAESQDLTARIRARRQAGVRAGTIDPALPGEHAVHGTQPGAELQVDRLVAASEARSRRARVSEEVVEMDYTDYSTETEDKAALSPEDGGDVLGAEAVVEGHKVIAAMLPSALPPSIPEPSTDFMPEPDSLLLDSRFSDLQADVDALHAKIDGLAKGLVLIAAAHAEMDASISELTKVVEGINAYIQLPPDPPEPGFWRRLFDGRPGYGPDYDILG